MPSQPIRLHAPTHLSDGSDPLFPFTAGLITPALNAGTVQTVVFGIRYSGGLATWTIGATPSEHAVYVGYMTIQLLTPGVTGGYVITNLLDGLPRGLFIPTHAYDLIGQGVTQQQATGITYPAFIDGDGKLWTYAAGIGSARAPIGSAFPFAYAANDILFMGSLTIPAT